MYVATASNHILYRSNVSMYTTCFEVNIDLGDCFMLSYISTYPSELAGEVLQASVLPPPAAIAKWTPYVQDNIGNLGIH